MSNENFERRRYRSSREKEKLRRCIEVLLRKTKDKINDAGKQHVNEFIEGLRIHQNELEIQKTESAIDLVFSDVVMPGKINGYDLYRWVKATRPQVKVLLSTALRSGETEQLAKAGELPAPIALPKPYTKEQLTEAIRDVFRI